MKTIAVATSDDVQEGLLFPSNAGFTKLLLTRVDGKACAFINKCPHLGLSLERGKLENGVVTCPWHSSSFNVVTGENMDWCTGFVGNTMPAWTRKLIAMGKKPAGLVMLETEESHGAVCVKIE